ncbi:GGDEF domain-containing protein [Rheinheimera sp.]|uniref:GGDEF domain-containing protein n=1 Tax=Rheinheimera sp. TaxID=1869214 RepID=UPI004047613E
MLQRLKDDFYLAMLTLVGAIIVLCVTPYGIYRLLSGNLLVGLADLIMVLCSVLAVRSAWHTGDTVKPGLFMAVIFCVGAVLVCISLGVDGLFWVYPFLVFVFFLVSPLRAFGLLIVMLSTLFIVAWYHPGVIFSSNFQLLVFFVTTSNTSVFAFIFAYRAQIQREELQRLATTDGLTGAANRRTLNEQLALAIRDFKLANRSFGLMVLDLDHFKHINDNYGHKTGDRMLTELIPLLQSLLRNSDQVFRFGGEEFVVLLADIRQADLLKLADKIRHGVATRLTLPDGKELTTSIGAAMLKPAEDWEDWLHRADMALYQAKNDGRNRVVAAS